MLNHSRREKQPSSSQPQDAKRTFMGRMLDRLSVPFVNIGLYLAEKIVLDVIIQVERAKKDSNPDVSFLNLERYRRTGR